MRIIGVSKLLLTSHKNNCFSQYKNNWDFQRFGLLFMESMFCIGFVHKPVRLFIFHSENGSSGFKPMSVTPLTPSKAPMKWASFSVKSAFGWPDFAACWDLKAPLKRRRRGMVLWFVGVIRKIANSKALEKNK